MVRRTEARRGRRHATPSKRRTHSLLCVRTPEVVNDVVGMDELSRPSQQLGVEEVSSGMAEILPEMVNQLSPEGEVKPDADETLYGGASSLKQILSQFRQR